MASSTSFIPPAIFRGKMTTGILVTSCLLQMASSGEQSKKASSVFLIA